MNLTLVTQCVGGLFVLVPVSDCIFFFCACSDLKCVFMLFRLVKLTAGHVWIFMSLPLPIV